ncbi:hypothetical protein [Paenibacillus xylanexedens]|uniref:hypothetical protein n=1 Tax=Paenibacillus xylanexedens TaxID=528191 RepID=UPI0011A6C180|nr:hypothetical protein [Paenibacillus xylanexedens]
MGLFSFGKRKQKTALAGRTSGGSRGRSSGSGGYVSVNDFGGSRTTMPKFTMGGGGVGGSLPKKVQSDLGLDERTLQSATIEDLMDILADAHGDVSYAIWNFMRLGNTKYNIKVYKPMGDGTEDETMKKVVTDFFDMLEIPDPTRFSMNRSIEKVLGQMIFAVVTRGAAAGELVMGAGNTEVAFIAPVDPGTITFRYEGDRYVPYQDDDKISLDLPTFFYEGLDERIDDPYGRGPLVSAINMIMFQLQVLNDIKAVVHNQGYPRFDIKILEEVLLRRMPIGVRNNEEESQKWLNGRLNEIIEMYQNLDPDDTFVHYDSIEVGMAGGGSGGGALIDPQKLMTVLDNMLMTGLKTLSTILGRRSTGNTESFAKIEIKLYIQGVRAIQRVVERLMGRMLTAMLNLGGKQGIVKFQFEEIEIRTEMEQAQFNQIHLLNVALMRNEGWIDQNEAAMRAVGHAPVGESLLLPQAPTNADGGTPQGQTDTNASARGGTTEDS